MKTSVEFCPSCNGAILKGVTSWGGSICHCSPLSRAKTPEEMLEAMRGMFVSPSQMGEINHLRLRVEERKVAALKAEIARLNDDLASRDQLISTQNLVAREEMKIQPRWKEHFFAKEEEAKKLREIAKKSIDLALDVTSGVIYWKPPEARVRAEELSAALEAVK